MANTPKVTPKLFNGVKMLLAGGATANEVREYFDLSAKTVTIIRQAETYDEYKNICAAIAIERRKAKPVAKPVEEKPVETPITAVAVVEPIQKPTPQYMPWATQQEILRLLKEQNEYLKLLSNKLVFIVEQLA